MPGEFFKEAYNAVSNCLCGKQDQDNDVTFDKNELEEGFLVELQPIVETGFFSTWFESKRELGSDIPDDIFERSEQDNDRSDDDTQSSNSSFSL